MRTLVHNEVLDSKEEGVVEKELVEVGTVPSDLELKPPCFVP